MTEQKARRIYQELKPQDSVTAYIRVLASYIDTVKDDIHNSNSKGEKMLIAKMAIGNIQLLNCTLLEEGELPKRFEYDIDYIRMYALGIDVYDAI